MLRTTAAGLRPSAPSPRPSGLPGWARAADFVALGLAIVALTVAASGGFRLHLGEWRLALTSPYRPLLWAVAIGVARHAVARHESMSGHLWSWIGGWAGSVPFFTASTVALATRPVVFLAGYLAVFMFGYAPGAEPFHDFDSELQNLPLRWDAGWYLRIARDGYEFSPAAGAESQQNIVFFPAFPLLVRGVALLLGNHHAGRVRARGHRDVARPVRGGAGVSLSALARIPDRRPGSDGVVAARGVSVCDLLRRDLFRIVVPARNRRGVSSIPARRARACRRVGYCSSASPGPMASCSARRLRSVAFERRASLRKGRIVAPATAAAMPARVGALLYSAFIWRLSGSPFAWAAGHAAWGRHYQGLGHLVTDRYVSFPTQVFLPMSASNRMTSSTHWAFSSSSPRPGQWPAASRSPMRRSS